MGKKVIWDYNSEKKKYFPYLVENGERKIIKGFGPLYDSTPQDLRDLINSRFLIEFDYRKGNFVSKMEVDKFEKLYLDYIKKNSEKKPESVKPKAPKETKISKETKTSKETKKECVKPVKYSGKGRPVKGSKEAKEHMAYIRSLQKPICST